MPMVGLLEKKGKQHFTLDGTAVNAGGIIEFFDTDEDSTPQTVYSDPIGKSPLGVSVKLDSTGRLAASIYQNTSPIRIVIKNSAGDVIVPADDYPGADADAEELAPFLKRISASTTLIGTDNVLTVGQAGETFILDKTAGDVSVELPPAEEVDSGKSFYFTVMGFYFTATVTAVDVDGYETIRSIKETSFEVKSTGASYDYVGEYDLSQLVDDSNIEDIKIISTIIPSSNRDEMSQGHIDGNIMSLDVEFLDVILNIGPGGCRDDTNNYDIRSAITLKKIINAPWAFGDGKGMLDTGIVEAFDWYHIFRIVNPIVWNVDIIASKSLFSPLMPSGYVLKRYIGSVRVNTNVFIEPFIQNNDRFTMYDPSLNHIDLDSDADAFKPSSVGTPDGVRCLTAYNISTEQEAAGFYFTYPEIKDENPELTLAPLFTFRLDHDTGTSRVGGQVQTVTDFESSIHYRADDNGDDLRLSTVFYNNVRGRNTPPVDPPWL